MTLGGRSAGVAWALALALSLMFAACSSAPTPASSPIASASIVASASGGPGASADTPASPVTGVLVGIDSAGLSQVSGFRLRLDDGRELAFRIGTLENGADFPPGHLAEHLASSSPVRVFFRVEGGDLVVYRLEDAS